MAALTSAHLYGRHLVLEYAKDDEEDQDLDVLRKRYAHTSEPFFITH